MGTRRHLDLKVAHIDDVHAHDGARILGRYDLQRKDVVRSNRPAGCLILDATTSGGR